MEPLTADDVRAIRAALTWGDQHAAKSKLKGDDSGDLAAFAMHRAAIRLGMIEKGATLQTFLDLVPLDAMNEALEELRDPTSPTTET